MNESNAGGKFDEVKGKIKQGLGETFGSEKLADEGAADQVKGHAKETWGNVKDTASNLTDKARTDADLKVGETTASAHQTGGNLRQDVTNAAERAKDSISRGLDHLEGKDKA